MSMLDRMRAVCRRLVEGVFVGVFVENLFFGLNKNRKAPGNSGMVSSRGPKLKGWNGDLQRRLKRSRIESPGCCLLLGG